MILSKISNRQIRPNFTEKELFSKSPDAPLSHFLSDEAINALQYIRNYYGKPITPTSTYRTKKHNDSIGSNEKSQHRLGNAIDFTTDKETLNKIKKDLRNKNSELFRNLRILGIGGFGIYKNFIHIDSRKSGLNKDSFGSFAFWDEKDKKKGKFEDGNEKKPNILIIVVLMTIIFILYKRQ